ncbi:MAG: hypothetical protein CVU84_06370 [Firmicutes bacterium HGW-Firmicutes-1]|jgi:hypothetical protein|nr:MAG: hypothetical protein CVU84_06370 [Firmicutes bacterium HGW-Firmicutes-1]
MGNSIGKIFTVFLAVLLLFIYPLIQMFQQQESTTRNFVYIETTKLVDAVRNIGNLTPQMYEEYTSKLAATNNYYNISLEHQHRKYDPVYEDPLDLSTFKEDFGVNYSAFYTNDILDILFPVDGRLQNKYEFSRGDYFLIRVVNKNKTLATRVGQLLYGSELPTETIFVQYGGMIK